MDYEIRPLIASDMGTVCKIISKIGVSKFKDCFDVTDIKGKDAEAIGLTVVFDIAGIIIDNIPNAEKDIQDFLSSLTDMDVADIQKMPFADYGELIIAVITKDDFKDFFKHVMKLFNQ
ncbi:MAG: hypothetical protein HUJ98_01005 [Bacteroidaceae bacterium]|nr:hypothetical protein [Bacteroidaceae bacterium]